MIHRLPRSPLQARARSTRAPRLAAGFSALSVVVLCLLWAAPAHGQAQEVEEEEIRSHTQGFFLQSHIAGHGLTVEDDATDSGRGLGLKLGYGFTPLFTLYLGVDGATMGVGDSTTQGFIARDYTLVYLDLGVRFNFRSGASAVVPYLDGSISGVASTYDTAFGDATFTGGGLSLGGGVQYFFSPEFALNGGLQFTLGQYNEIEMGGQSEGIDLDLTSARLNVGVSWYPFR